MVTKTAREQDAWDVLASVLDPELPMLSIVDLGIVRAVSVADGGVRVAITPTFTACPAMRAIETDAATALRAAGFDPVAIETVLSPPWTTDWMSASARAKLKDAGIAPPDPVARKADWRDALRAVACPRCESGDTILISAFGSTPCKALHRCRGCGEVFEGFKCG